MISCKYVFIQCTIYKETIVTGNLLKLKQNWQEAPDWNVFWLTVWLHSINFKTTEPIREGIKSVRSSKNLDKANLCFKKNSSWKDSVGEK